MAARHRRAQWLAPAVPQVTAAAPSPTKLASRRRVKGRDLVIAIDAGHGGQDPGAIGRGGTREKDVTLAIARRLAAEIDAEDGMRAVLIRDGDYFITLGGRTRKARQLGADMFVSIHADSVQNRAVSGSSVYVLSLRGASDEAARWLAETRERGRPEGRRLARRQETTCWRRCCSTSRRRNRSATASRRPTACSTALRGVGNVHGTRVQHAGFVVLKSPDIPSMLVETAFISNADRRAAPARSRSPAAHRRGDPHAACATTGTTTRRPARSSRPSWPRGAAARRTPARRVAGR